MKFRVAKFRCDDCGHLWEKNGVAHRSHKNVKSFVKIRGNVQTCPNCDSALSVRILSKGE